MKLALVGLAIIAMAHAGSYEILDMEKIIKDVNDAQTTWTAGHNFAPDTPYDYIKGLMGAKLDHKGPPLRTISYSGVDIPKEFDARKKWPECPTISHIPDQGACGSCWAISAASAFSDRACIASNGTFTTPLSAEELMTCCYGCGRVCSRGYSSAAWEYLKLKGICTGGDYNSEVGCQPYQVPSGKLHVKEPRPQNSDKTDDKLYCQYQCINPKYTTPFDADLHKTSSAYILPTVEAAQEDILKYGSIGTSFAVYEDFLAYKKGVYHYVSGKLVGGHAVRVIGWGTEQGMPYWLVANSWNSDWGANGTFKILRGKDECGFEDELVAGRI